MAGSSDVTAVLAARNTAVVFPAGAITANDTGYAYLDVSTMDASKVLFLVSRAGGKAETLVVKNGAEYSAEGIGDYTKATTVAGEYIAGPFETARFKDSNGYIQLAASTASTGVISVRAILLP